LVAYFAYEFISTKSLPGMKGLLKLLPGLGVVVVLNFAFIFGVYGVGDSVMNRRLEPEEVSSVRIVRLSNTHGNTYATLQLGNVELTDPDAITALTNTLSRNINSPSSRWQSPHPITVVFNTSSPFGVRRSLNMNEAQWRRLMPALYENEAFIEAHMNLPEDPVYTSVWVLRAPDRDGWREQFNVAYDEAAMVIYETLREEVRELDFETWYMLLTRVGWHGYGVSHEVHGYISVSGFVGRYSYWDSFPITSYTPRTAELLYELTPQRHRWSVAD